MKQVIHAPDLSLIRSYFLLHEKPEGMVYQLHGLFWHDFSMIDYVMYCIILVTLYITIVSGVIMIFFAIVISFIIICLKL